MDKVEIVASQTGCQKCIQLQRLSEMICTAVDDTCCFAKHIELICEWWHDDVQCSKAKSEAQMYEAKTEDQMDKAKTEAWWLWQK